MSILSEFQRYHGAGESPDVNDSGEYGAPSRTLFTALDPGDLHQRIDVTDEHDTVRYQTKSSVITVRGKTDIFDSSGTLVAHLEKKPISLHQKHYITMADGREMTLSNELFHVFKDITNIQGLDWQLRGNVLGLSFTLFDRNGDPIAVIGQKIVSLHNRCSIDPVSAAARAGCSGHRDRAAEDARRPA